MENKEEYTIYITTKTGMPYSLITFKTFQECLNSLDGMISLEKERHRPYFVLNEFFENEYPTYIGGKIFCIKKRTVTNWETLEEIPGTRTHKKNNIIQFDQYRKNTAQI